MSWLAHYQSQARYNRWMNDKLYGLAAGLSDQERKRDRGAFFGSIHGTFNHLLLGDTLWMERFTGQPLLPRDESGQPVTVRSMAQELYADFGALSAARRAVDDAIIQYVATLDEPTLAGQLIYKTSRGEPQAHLLWWAVSHFFNHQTHHRGQVTTLLSQAGLDPGVTDLVVLLRSESQ